MTASAMWIRNNMLCFPDQYQRQLTEAELKVERSLQKLSIPDWYLNKRSNPPKILSNVTPIECRPPPWKTFDRKSTAKAPTSNSQDTFTKPKPEKCRNTKTTTVCGTYRVSRDSKSSDPRKNSPSKSSKIELFDTKIPEVKLSKNISRTFPKVSPSRKIQNINIVFPPGPKIKVSNALLESDTVRPDGTRYRTFVLKKQSAEDEQTDSKDDSVSHQTPTKSRRNESIEVANISLRTPNFKGNFKVRAFSTPKYTAVNLFSSTVIEDSPKSHTESLLEKTEDFHDSSNQRLSQTFQETPKTKRSCCLNLFLERNVRSIDPILYQKDDGPTSASPKPSLVRDIVKKIDSRNQPVQERKANLKTLKDRQIKPSINSNPENGEKRSTLEGRSPSTRFLYAKKKSTELENIVQSKKQPRGKSAVQEIIEELNEKCKFSTFVKPKNRVTVGKQNFVKQLVNALEKGDTSEVDVLVNRKLMDEEEESSSESEVKSGVSSTTISVKDTDTDCSSSDYDQKSPILKSDEENHFQYGIMAPEGLKKNKKNANHVDEDDSVYWIPVSRCKLPRTSSVLSMKTVSTGKSPCMSPIRGDSEVESSRKDTWGTTFKKTSVLTSKFSRIDETGVIDSGYSDRSDRSGVHSDSSTIDVA